jgi:hypothetical protein
MATKPANGKRKLLRHIRSHKRILNAATRALRGKRNGRKK